MSFGAVTNPASGLAIGWTHSGEDNLVAAKKCLEGLSKTMAKIIENFKFEDGKKIDNQYLGFNSLKLQR